MERRWTEKIKEMSDEELIRTTERKGLWSIVAAEEILSRMSKERIIDGRKFHAILEIRGTQGTRKETKEVKEEAVKLIKEKGFLDERSVLVILDEIDSQEILESVIRKYLGESKNIPNYLLGKMIRRIKLLSLKEVLARIVLDQNPSTDDFLVIEEELEGSPLQIEAEDKHWKAGMSTDDFTWLVADGSPLGSPLQAERNWEKGKKGMIEKLSIEQLNEIFRYTEALIVKIEVREELLSRLEEELERLRKTLKKNPANTKIEYRLWDLEKIKEEVKGESKKMELYAALTT